MRTKILILFFHLYYTSASLAIIKVSHRDAKTALLNLEDMVLSFPNSESDYFQVELSLIQIFINENESKVKVHQDFTYAAPLHTFQSTNSSYIKVLHFRDFLIETLSKYYGMFETHEVRTNNNLLHKIFLEFLNEFVTRIKILFKVLASNEIQLENLKTILIHVFCLTSWCVTQTNIEDNLCSVNAKLLELDIKNRDRKKFSFQDKYQPVILSFSRSLKHFQNFSVEISSDFRLFFESNLQIYDEIFSFFIGLSEELKKQQIPEFSENDMNSVLQLVGLKKTLPQINIHKTNLHEHLKSLEENLDMEFLSEIESFLLELKRESYFLMEIIEIFSELENVIDQHL